jgi:hypothetical protein
MKTANLGDFLFWKGKLAKIISVTTRRSVGIEIQDPERCPHCNGELERKQFDVIPESPLFQENAEPVQTIEK